MASFNIEVSSYDSKQGGNEANYTAYNNLKKVNTFYSAVYTISGLKPNSDYDFYVNGTKKNTSVAQGDHSSYVLNALKKAETSNFRIAFYIGIQFSNFSIGGNRFRTELESIKSCIINPHNPKPTRVLNQETDRTGYEVLHSLEGLKLQPQTINFFLAITTP